MNRRPSIVAIAALILAGLALASSIARPSLGQKASVPAPERRFVVAVGGLNLSDVFVTDTATGQTWKRTQYNMDAGWSDLGKPPAN